MVAKEISLDPSKDKGGDIGWAPLQTLSPTFESVARDLAVGKCSDPFLASEPDANSDDPNAPSPPYALLVISEKASDMPVTNDQLMVLKSRVYSDWLSNQMQSPELKVAFSGFHGRGYDSETDAWLYYQAQRLLKAQQGSQTPTTSASPTTQP